MKFDACFNITVLYIKSLVLASTYFLVLCLFQVSIEFHGRCGCDLTYVVIVIILTDLPGIWVVTNSETVVKWIGNSFLENARKVWISIECICTALPIQPAVNYGDIYWPLDNSLWAVTNKYFSTFHFHDVLTIKNSLFKS